MRSFYEYLVEDGLRERNPVRKGESGRHGRQPKRGLVRPIERAPWIPNDVAWASMLDACAIEPLRNRLMVAMAYDGALRREELVQIQIDDVDPAYSLIHLRAETTKGRRAREVAFGTATGRLLVGYLRERGRVFGRVNGRLFLSASRRNRGAPIGIWSWSKIVEAIAERAGLPRFSTHTFRHLRLTDLARADWTVDQIAQYAGHRDLSTTMLAVHPPQRPRACGPFPAEHGIDSPRERAPARDPRESMTTAVVCATSHVTSRLDLDNYEGSPSLSPTEQAALARVCGRASRVVLAPEWPGCDAPMLCARAAVSTAHLPPKEWPETGTG